jgi:predicted membrane protein
VKESKGAKCDTVWENHCIIFFIFFFILSPLFILLFFLWYLFIILFYFFRYVFAWKKKCMSQCTQTSDLLMENQRKKTNFQFRKKHWNGEIFFRPQYEIMFIRLSLKRIAKIHIQHRESGEKKTHIKDDWWLWIAL